MVFFIESYWYNSFLRGFDHIYTHRVELHERVHNSGILILYYDVRTVHILENLIFRTSSTDLKKMEISPLLEEETRNCFHFKNRQSACRPAYLLRSPLRYWYVLQEKMCLIEVIIEGFSPLFLETF